VIISTDILLPFPRSIVYATYRDKLDELIPYMRNIRSINAKSREVKNGVLVCVNEWHGGGEIPAVARTILSEEMLSWTEHNAWDDSSYKMNWKIETHAFTEAVHCAGENHFLDRNGATLVKSRGKLEIDAKEIKGVPFFISKQIANLVEDFLSQKIEPNLKEMGEGVQQYLESQAVQV